MKIPIGSTVVKTNYSAASGMAYRVYKKQFPHIVCLCHYGSDVHWIVDEYLTERNTNDLVFIYRKDNPLQYTLAFLCDLYKIADPPKVSDLK